MKNSLVAFAIIMIILVSGVAGYVVGMGQTVTKTQYSTDTSSFTQTTILTETMSGSTITEMISPVSCETTYSNGTSFTELALPQNAGSSVGLCIRYFSYNPNGTTINTLDQLTIFSPVQTNGTLKNANSSFSISANIDHVQLGGPQMANEGYAVTYTINSTGHAPSGTYEIGLSSGLYPSDIICGYGIYITLQVGNATNPIVMTSCHYLPTPEANPGLVYSEIAGLTNSSLQ